MSHVTDVVLVCSLCEAGQTALLRAMARLALYKSEPKITAGAAAQHLVYRAAVNANSDVRRGFRDARTFREGVAAFLGSLPWIEQRGVVLLFQDEHDVGPSVHVFSEEGEFHTALDSVPW